MSAACGGRSRTPVHAMHCCCLAPMCPRPLLLLQLPAHRPEPAHRPGAAAAPQLARGAPARHWQGRQGGAPGLSLGMAWWPGADCVRQQVARLRVPGRRRPARPSPTAASAFFPRLNPPGGGLAHQAPGVSAATGHRAPRCPAVGGPVGPVGQPGALREALLPLPGTALAATRGLQACAVAEPQAFAAHLLRCFMQGGRPGRPPRLCRRAALDGELGGRVAGATEWQACAGCCCRRPMRGRWWQPRHGRLAACCCITSRPPLWAQATLDACNEEDFCIIHPN